MDSIKVQLSNGEAYLKPFIDTQTDDEYMDILMDGIQKPAYEVSEKELEEIEQLPIQERLKIKNSLSPQIPTRNATRAINYLAYSLVDKLIIDGVEKPPVKAYIQTLNKVDTNKIKQAAMKINEEMQSKKKTKAE